MKTTVIIIRHCEAEGNIKRFFQGHTDQAINWNLKPWDFCAPEGESMREVYQRISTAVWDIAMQNAGKTIVIASHGCAIRCLMCRVKGLPIENLNDVDWCDNTSLNVIEFDDNFNPTIVCENDCSHLAQGMSAMDSQTWWRAENRDNMDFSN